MYEYRLCLYVCDLDVALFHSWLQGVTSKSVKNSENSLVVVSLDIVNREILDLERGQRIAERMDVGVRVEEYYMGKERETRQGWFKLCVGGFGTRKTPAAEPHYARAGVALLSGGKGYSDDEKGVEVADNVIVRHCF